MRTLPIVLTFLISFSILSTPASAQRSIVVGGAIGIGAFCFKKLNTCRAIAGGVAAGLAGGAAGSALDSSRRSLEKARNQAAAGATITPPGFCKQDDFNSLNAAVNRVCKAVELKACVPGESPIAMNAKAAAFKLCAQARARREDACFRGGDVGHRQQISQMWSAHNRCLSMGG